MIDDCQCNFVTIKNNYEIYDELFPINVFPLAMMKSRHTTSTYGIITMSDTVNKDILQKIKNNNVKLIDILCGNLYILLHEEFVFNTHNIMKNYITLI